jgi:hypothetical protein
MDDVGIFYCHLVYFTALWYFLRPFGKYYRYLVYFYPFGMLHQDKSGNPAADWRSSQSYTYI